MSRTRVLISVGVVVLIGGGWFAVKWRARGPDQASVSDAVSRFRDENGSPSTTVERPEDGDLTIPMPGVYTYRGEGAERLSFLGMDQPQGPTLPATVVADGNGCWSFSIEYNSFHTQQWTWCHQQRRMYERGGSVQQSFDFGAFKMDERSTSTCDPAFTAIDLRATPGDEYRVHCVTTSKTTDAENQSRGTNTFVGAEHVVIAGESVDALHYRFDRRITGGQTGRDVIDIWYDARTGLPLRNKHDIEVVSPAPAPLDEVTYSETGEWELTSLTPKR